jgi:hypothetical protein
MAEKNKSETLRVRDSDGIWRETVTSEKSRQNQRKAILSSDHELLKSRKQGLSARQLSMPLPPITANGVVAFGIWIPSECAEITSIDVAYLTKPLSALGTIFLNVTRTEAAADTLVQDDPAGLDLESLTDKVPTSVASLAAAKGSRVVQRGSYIHGAITSDNADAVDGVGGVITINYKIFK